MMKWGRAGQAPLSSGRDLEEIRCRREEAVVAMSRVGSFRCVAGALPLVLRRDVVVRLDVLPVALVPPVEDLGGDEDGGEGGGDDADEEGEGDVVQLAAAGLALILWLAAPFC